ncbi:MAG: DUF4124 domain-containing protein [Rhodocyclaceae bacterium]|nr:DUF4124 domain-containing protein [Rhodocyclaceae bacterium]
MSPRFHHPRLRPALRTLLAGTALLSFATLCGAADVYRWKDANGVTHYSATPPPDQAARRLELRPLPPPKDLEPERERLQRQREAANRDAAVARDREASAAQREQEAEARIQRCGLARQQLGILKAGGPVYGRDSEGRRAYLDGADREAALERARAEYREACRGVDGDSMRTAARQAAKDVRSASRCADMRERVAQLTRPGARAGGEDIRRAREAMEKQCGG